MIPLIQNNKGVSLPLMTGLITLLLVASVSINELIIRDMRSGQRIEASNKAYMAAEAGIEDALYELSPHSAGYETKTATQTFRTAKFDDKDWHNEWTIESMSTKNPWKEKMYKNQKVVLALFKDSDRSTTGANAINYYIFKQSDITALNVSDFQITFSIPNAGTIIGSGSALQINNDQDNALNEDSANPKGKDDDGDGQIDEDNNEDIVILWKLSDGKSSLIPTSDCISDQGSSICEKDFNSPSYSVTLSAASEGVDEAVNKKTIGAFINAAINSTGGANSKIYIEFLIVAPMEHTATAGGKKSDIPYIEYEVNSNAAKIPYPKFTIKSDGYYRNFKQSITATVTPKTTVPLFDFTIIQGE